jgi:Tfp pilus assembly protein PilF
VSIINQMLKDLERRRGREPGGAALPRSDGRAAGRGRFPAAGRAILAVLGLAAVAAVTVAVLPKKTGPAPAQTAQAEQSKADSAASSRDLRPEPAAGNAAPPAPERPGAAPADALPEPPQAPLETWPQPAGTDYLGIATGTAPIVTAAGAAADAGSGANPESPTARQSSVGDAGSAAPAPPAGTAKAVRRRAGAQQPPMRITRTPEPAVRGPAEEARRLAEQGFPARAAELLNRHLAEQPYDSAARRQLAELYTDLGWTVQSEAILKEGLALDPGAADLANSYARRLLEKGKNGEAEALLERAAAKASPAGKAESMAALAAVYLQNGHPPLAERLYRNILEQQPDNGAWRMGLAISLEQQGKKREALEAYREALYKGDLAPLVQRYVAGRIGELGEEDP